MFRMVVGRIRRLGLLRMADVYFWDGTPQSLPKADIVCIRHGAAHPGPAESFTTLHIPLGAQDDAMLHAFHRLSRKSIHAAAGMSFAVNAPHVPDDAEYHAWLSWEEAFHLDRKSVV